MTLITISNVGSIGVWKDRPAHLIPPEAWSDANNMRFYKRLAIRMLGQAQVFGTPSVAPGFIMNVPAPASSFWFYMSKTKAYVYDSGVHTEVTRSSGGDYTAAEYRDWNGCILGGIPIFNNYADVPQFWSALSVGTHLAGLTSWPSTLRARIIRNYGPFLVAMNLSDSGTLYQQTVRWSASADPGTIPSTWSLTDATKDAGQLHLTDVQGGPIIDAMLLGGVLMIYKTSSAHALRYIGGVNVMSPDLITHAGMLAARCGCVIDSGKRHFVVSQDDVYTHSGTLSSVDYPLEEKDKDFLFADIDVTNFANSFAYDNPAFREAVFAYPSSGNTFPNKALIFDYRNSTISFRDFDGNAVGIGDYTDSTGTAWNSLSGSWDSQTSQWSTQARRKLIMAKASAPKMYGMDSGYAFGAATPTAFLERTGLAVVGKDRQGQPIVDYDSRKMINRIWPKIRGDAQVAVRIGSQEELDGTVIWSPSKIYDPSQKYLDFDEVGAVGRLNAIRFESADNRAWQLEGYDIDLTVVSQL